MNRRLQDHPIVKVIEMLDGLAAKANQHALECFLSLSLYIYIHIISITFENV